MATTFDEIIDLALLSIQDYKLDALANDTNNQSAFQTITEGFLLRGLPEFNTCKQSLAYDENSRTFVSTFTPLEKSILADLWVEKWLEWKVNNITQFELKMTTSDFKHFSEAENLKQKSDWLDRIREKVKQKMTDYDYDDSELFQQWANGNFFS